jgi:hypothetical protein
MDLGGLNGGTFIGNTGRNSGAPSSGNTRKITRGRRGEISAGEAEPGVCLRTRIGTGIGWAVGGGKCVIRVDPGVVNYW